jgi:hypothetical protein
VADDSPAPSLPQRVPGSNRHAPGYDREPGAKPVGPVALPEDVVRRIRDALDSMREEASPQDRRAGTGRPAALPRRVPGASNDPSPPAVAAGPRLPSRTRSHLDEASTDEFPAINPSPPGGGEESTVRAEVATAVSAEPQPAPAPLPATEELPPRQDRPDEAGPPPMPRPGLDEAATEEFAAISPSLPGGGEKIGRTRQAKSPARRKGKPARRADGPARISKPPPSPVPSGSAQSVSQMALVFPLEPPGEDAAAIRPALIVPQRGRQARQIGWPIAVLTLVCVSLALVLTHHTHTSAAASGLETKASAEATVRNHAAAWVATHVSRIDKISCDPMMCQSLEADRIPAASLRVLRPGAAHLPRSGVIVVTAAVGHMVGNRRITTYAPRAIASFGSGRGRISIRVIYPPGTAVDSSPLGKGHRST